jgi:hypothetical protein
MVSNPAARKRAAKVLEKQPDDVVDSEVTEEELELLNQISDEELEEAEEAEEADEDVEEELPEEKPLAKATGKKIGKQIYANLIGGLVYYYKGVRFEHNKPQAVSLETAKYLKESKRTVIVNGKSYHEKVFKLGYDTQSILDKSLPENNDQAYNELYQ